MHMSAWQNSAASIPTSKSSTFSIHSAGIPVITWHLSRTGSSDRVSFCSRRFEMLILAIYIRGRHRIFLPTVLAAVAEGELRVGAPNLRFYPAQDAFNERVFRRCANRNCENIQGGVKMWRHGSRLRKLGSRMDSDVLCSWKSWSMFKQKIAEMEWLGHGRS